MNNKMSWIEKTYNTVKVKIKACELESIINCNNCNLNYNSHTSRERLLCHLSGRRNVRGNMPGYPIGNPSQNDHQICLDVKTHRFLNVVGAMHFHKK